MEAPDPRSDPLLQAANALRSCEAIVVMAGAGMSAESGIPVFRGPGGLYTTVASELATQPIPQLLATEPRRAWGLLWQLRGLFDALPHEGYATLREWAATRSHFIFTSNVDGLFQKAGFDEEHVYEIHGNASYLQHHNPEDFEGPIWPMDEDLELTLDPETGLVTGDLPTCPTTGQLARPNVLFFCDFWWLPGRSAEQEERFQTWLESARKKQLLILEIGAGTGLPMVRNKAEYFFQSIPGSSMIRINPVPEPVPPGCIALQLTAREALLAISEIL